MAYGSLQTTKAMESKRVRAEIAGLEKQKSDLEFVIQGKITEYGTLYKKIEATKGEIAEFQTRLSLLKEIEKSKTEVLSHLDELILTRKDEITGHIEPKKAQIAHLNEHIVYLSSSLDLITKSVHSLADERAELESLRAKRAMEELKLTALQGELERTRAKVASANEDFMNTLKDEHAVRDDLDKKISKHEQDVAHFKKRKEVIKFYAERLEAAYQQGGSPLPSSIKEIIGSLKG